MKKQFFICLTAMSFAAAAISATHINGSNQVLPTTVIRDTVPNSGRSMDTSGKWNNTNKNTNSNRMKNKNKNSDTSMHNNGMNDGMNDGMNNGTNRTDSSSSTPPPQQ